MLELDEVVWPKSGFLFLLLALHADVRKGVNGDSIYEGRLRVLRGHEGKLVQVLPITDRFEKRAKPMQGLGFPCARHSMQDGSKRFRPSLLVDPFFDRFGVAPLHNGCKNLLLLLVGGWCQPGLVQSLQPRPGRVQPEGSVVHGHRAWRLRLLGE